MIIYLHGFDSTSPEIMRKVLQLQFIDPDVRFLSYSTFASTSRYATSTQKTDKLIKSTKQPVLICGVG